MSKHTHKVMNRSKNSYSRKLLRKLKEGQRELALNGFSRPTEETASLSSGMPEEEDGRLRQEGYF